MTTEELLSKIQRLLALSGSPNEHEAKLALAKAQNLMIEHNVSIEEVQGFQENTTNFTTDTAYKHESQTLPYEMEWVLVVIKDFFFVRTITSPQWEWLKNNNINRKKKKIINILFFGTPENIAVAKHVFHYLRRTFRELWIQYKNQHNAQRYAAKSFYYGLYHGFTTKLTEERKVYNEKTQTALTIINDLLEEELNKQFKLVSKKLNTGHSQKAYDDGFIQGKKINLADPITTTNNEEKKLIAQ